MKAIKVSARQNELSKDTISGHAIKPRRIFIDCTNTYLTGLNTGIQRVVRGLVDREASLSLHAGAPCVPVIVFQGQYWPFSKEQRTLVQDKINGCARSRRTARGRFVKFQNAILGLSERLHIPRGIAEMPLSVIRHVLARLLWRIQEVAPLLVLREHKVRAIKPKEHDLLIIPDAFWGEYGQLSAIELFAKAGCSIVPVIHDVVPLTHPEYFPHFNVQPFTDGLERILAVSCGILTVSRSAMSDVGRYCSERGYKNLSLDYAYSGADFLKPSEDIARDIRQEITDRCDFRPFLMVGTVEPRKGYQTALDAYQLYQEGGGRRPLVIVGRLGWKETEIVTRMRAVASSCGSVYFYDDASDQELGALYKGAGALIFASHYEGFGLPLVEAMHQGLPVIASDIPVFREIGQQYPSYFRTGSAKDLCRALQEFDQIGNELCRPSRPWPSWDEAAPSYIDKAIRFYAQCRGKLK